MPSLQRFLDAQATHYDAALRELRAGRKQGHWIWFIFPQIDGLGTSGMSRFYAISGLDEARAYLAHPVLGPRLDECTRAILEWSGKRSVLDILGPIDAQKFASSMTLFEAAGSLPTCSEALGTVCDGVRDARTLVLLGLDPPPAQMRQISPPAGEPALPAADRSGARPQKSLPRA